MLDSVFEAVSQSNVESAFELGMVLIPASILAITTVRLTVSAISAAHEKEKKEWHVGHASVRSSSLDATLCGSTTGQQTSAKLLSPDVKKLMIRNDRRRAQQKFKGYK
jgi:hypothetical protein